MKNHLLILLLVLLWMGSAAAQNKSKSKLTFPVMSWGAISQSEISVDSYRKLSEVGVNIDIAFFQHADSIAKALDAAAKAGVRLMISCPELKSQPERIAERFRNHPALEGYFLGDEPSQSTFRTLADWAKALKAKDNKHYAFVNLYPDINSNKSKFGTASYREYVEAFDQIFPAPYLSFDFYPVVDGALHPRWFENLAFYADKYKSAGRPFWAFALTTSYLAYSEDTPQPTLDDFYQLYKSYRPEKTFVHGIPTLGELRLQVYANLAYGAQGIEYWSFRGYGSPLDAEGRRTIVFDRVQKVSREIQSLAGIFLGATVHSVAHTGTEIPNGTKRLTHLPEPIRLLETGGRGAIVSQLEHGDNRYLVVVNRDFANPMKLIIKTDATVKKVLKDGSLVPAMEYADATEIEPGDVAIYQYPAEKK
ncbi:MAG: hypothetical protein LWW85_01145 [Marinilabiliales bacterium]|nr:hypothetical protein [Marinilabiliales bacterium]